MAWVEVEVRVGKRALLECLRSGAGSYIMPMGILKRYYKDVCVWEKWSISVMIRNTKINPIKSNFCYIKRLKDISTARLTTPRSPSACTKTSRRHVSMAYRFTICNYCSSLYNSWKFPSLHLRQNIIQMRIMHDELIFQPSRKPDEIFS